MKIIDTHVHIGGENSGFHMTEEMVLTAMERYGISYSIVSNCDAAEMGHDLKYFKLQHTQEETLLRVLDFARKYPDKIGAAAWVKPNLQGMTKELLQIMEENIAYIKAIKIHPFHSNLSPTDEHYFPYFEFAAKHHLPVVSHTGGCEAAEPIHLYEAALLYKDVNFVMVHMGLESDNKAALDLLGKADNLYGDTTWVRMSTTIEAIRRYGNGKIVFGSDMPIDGVDTLLCNPKGDRNVYQDYLHVLPDLISTEAYEALMYKNAQKLFHL